MYKTRLAIYKKIEKIRGNPLLVYITSQRENASGIMAGDVIDEFIEQIEMLPSETEAVDLYIESNGGDPLVALRIISLLRTVVKKVSVIIPHSAYSAATLLALGADEIIMGKYGCLGPIDPQIIVKKKDGMDKHFAYEDIISFIDFAKSEVGLTEQVHVAETFKMLGGAIEPWDIGFAKRASSLSVSIGELLLKMHMNDTEAKLQARGIAEKLNKNFFSHGHSLNRDQAKEIGLKVVFAEPSLEKEIWAIHKDFELELQRREPFNPLAIFLKDPKASAYLKSPPPLNLNLNSLPQQLSQTIVQQVMNFVNNELLMETPEVDAEIKTVILESSRLASAACVKFRIVVNRDFNLNYNFRTVVLESGWKDIS